MRYAKAVVAAVSLVAASLTQALDDNNLSLEELGGIAAAVVLGAGAVYAVRNQQQ